METQAPKEFVDKINDTADCYDSQKLIIDYVAYYQKSSE